MSTQVAVPVSKQTLIKGDTDDMVTLTGNHFLGRWCHTRVIRRHLNAELDTAGADYMKLITDVAFIVLPSYAVIAMSPLGIPALMNVYQISVRGIKTN